MSAIQMLMPTASSPSFKPEVAPDQDKQVNTSARSSVQSKDKAAADTTINTSVSEAEDVQDSQSFDAMIAMLLQGFMQQKQDQAVTTDKPSFGSGFNVDPALLVFEDGVPVINPEFDLTTLPPDILKALTPGLPEGIPLQPMKTGSMHVETPDTRLIAAGLNPQQITEFQNYLAQNFSQPVTQTGSQNSTTNEPASMTVSTVIDPAAIGATPATTVTKAQPSFITLVNVVDDMVAQMDSVIKNTSVATDTSTQAALQVKLQDNNAQAKVSAHSSTQTSVPAPVPQSIVAPVPANAEPVQPVVQAPVKQEAPVSQPVVQAAIQTTTTVQTNNVASSSVMAETTVKSVQVDAPATTTIPVQSTAQLSVPSAAVVVTTTTGNNTTPVSGSDPYAAALYQTASSGGVTSQAATTGISPRADGTTHADAVRVNGMLETADLADSATIAADALPSVAASFSSETSLVVGPQQTLQTASSPLTTPVLQQAHASQAHPATQMVAAAMQKIVDGRASKSIAIEVDPPELGRVYIDVKMRASDPLEIRMVVENADTYMMLKRDAHMMESTLQQAGVNTDGLSLNLQLASDQGGFEQAMAGNTEGENNNSRGSGKADSSQAAPEAIAQESSVDWYTDEKTGRLRYNLTA